MAKREPTKREFLQVRLTPGDKERIEAAAAAEHLAPSTWARRVLMKALDDLPKTRGR